MWSAFWRISTRSRVTSPRMRTASPGPGKGWRQTILLGQAQLLADGAHLVLEEHAERLDEMVEAKLRGQAADVVVALDVVGVLADAGTLDHVGIGGSLAK